MASGPMSVPYPIQVPSFAAPAWYFQSSQRSGLTSFGPISARLLNS
jgi:hypothetical protein